jgi:chemotaxis protein CheX
MDLSGDDIHQLTGDTWSSMVGLAVEPTPAAAPFSAETLTGLISINGGWEGTVTLECTASLARTAAAAMFDMEPEELGTADVADALGELTNITGGGVKALLPGPCQLSLPSVVAGRNYNLSAPGARLLSETAFTSDGQQLVVRVFTSDGTSDPLTSGAN